MIALYSITIFLYFILYLIKSVINALKDDNSYNKDSIQKLNIQIEYLKEKEDKMLREHEVSFRFLL